LKKAVLFTALFAAFLMLINLSPIGVAGLSETSGSADILDFEVGYTYDEAHEMLSALGEGGRIFYLKRIMPLDFPFPFFYMLCFISWTALLLKLIKLKNRVKYLLFIPVLAMLCDWTENIGIIVMLTGYPDLPSWAVLLSSLSGTFKFIFMGGSILIICVLLIIFIYSAIRKSNQLKNR